MKHNDILSKVAMLKTVNVNRNNKYRRNIRKYNNCVGFSIDTLKNNTVVGYYNPINDFSEGSSLPPPSFNVIKSIIDTLTSKIAQSNVRPFFNTIHGSYKEMQTALQSQRFFDVYFDTQKVHDKVSKVFEDACVFDSGVIYIDLENHSIERALPFQVYTDPREVTYGTLSKIYYERTEYPVAALPFTIKNKSIDDCDYGIYFDTRNKVKAHIVNGVVIKTETFDYDTLPFLFLNYTKPTFGNSCLSVVDILYSLQSQIDMVASKISAASELTPGNTILLPEDSSIKATSLNNGVGNIMTYKMTPNMTGSPVSVVTPTFIDRDYFNLLETLIQRAYELVGLSQLSAMALKPTGLDSGVALSTMENIEGDRFETQLKQVIHLYTDIALACIKFFNSNDNILPEDDQTKRIKWGDVKKAVNSMKIQFSAADALSKDPSIKLQQLQQLAEAGIIPQSRIASLMELPDIQSGYNLANNAVNAVYSIIDDCLTKDIFEVPYYVPFTLLKEEIINVQLSLKAAMIETNISDIEKLDKLYAKVEQLEQQFTPAATVDEDTTMLEAEAASTQTSVTPDEMLQGADLNISTPLNQNGSWNGQYKQSQGN